MSGQRLTIQVCLVLLLHLFPSLEYIKSSFWLFERLKASNLKRIRPQSSSKSLMTMGITSKMGYIIVANPSSDDTLAATLEAQLAGSPS